MKAITTCPKCKETVETTDREDIDSGMSFHDCNGKQKSVKVKWKVFPENEQEMFEEELDGKDSYDLELPDELD